MGARTLVAVEGPNGRYDCYHSQWGGEHLEWLLSEEPLHDGSTRLVDEEPTHTGIPAERVLSIVDSHAYESLVVREGDDHLDAYLVCRLAIETGRGSDATTRQSAANERSEGPNGPAIALVPWPGPRPASRLRRFSRIAKGILGDAVEVDLLPAWLASAYLGVRLARHPDCTDQIRWYIPAVNR